MSKIQTLSMFYYGHSVKQDSQYLDFDEGNGELTAQLPIGDYTLEEFAEAVADAMTEAGTQDYVAYTTRGTSPVINISAGNNFDILCRTGSNFTQSAWELCGFTGVDKTGTNFYTGGQSGSVYRPQYPFFDYQSPEDYQLLESASVNITAKGAVQVINFGDGRRMECNMRIITDRAGLRLDPFYENVAGVDAARTFLKYLMTRQKVEFMPDYEVPAAFYKVQLESTESDRSGVGFKLKSMGVPDFYETGKLVFREVPD